MKRGIKMKLNPNPDLPAFLLQADLCTGDVVYMTPEGDRLNLKSQLSKYIFLAAANAESAVALLSGNIMCSKPEDLEILQPYLIH